MHSITESGVFRWLGRNDGSYWLQREIASSVQFIGWGNTGLRIFFSGGRWTVVQMAGGYYEYEEEVEQFEDVDDAKRFTEAHYLLTRR